jgi:hypothetical protein
LSFLCSFHSKNEHKKDNLKSSLAPANSFMISFGILSQKNSTIEIYWCALTKKGYILDYHIERHGTGPLYCITLWL